MRRASRCRPTRDVAAGRCIATRAIVHVPDVLSRIRDADASCERSRRRLATAASLAVPCCATDEPIGVDHRRRARARARSPTADRAAADLRRPGGHRDRERAAVHRAAGEQPRADHGAGQQTATSDILRVISRSQTDVQPVFDAIVASAVRLLGAYSGALTRVAGDQIELAALTSTDEAGDAALSGALPTAAPIRGSHRPGHSRSSAAQYRRRPDRSPSARSGTRRRSCPWLSKRGRGAAAPSRRGDRGDLGDPPRARRRSPTTRSRSSRPSPTRR